MGSSTDSSLFIFNNGQQVEHLLVYAYDIVLTSSSPLLLEGIKQDLAKEFKLRDLGGLHYLLGLEVTTKPGRLELSQTEYINDLLCKTNMHECRPIKTSMATNHKFSIDDSLLSHNGGCLTILYVNSPRHILLGE